MDNSADIRQWYVQGAEVQQGLRLLDKYAPNRYLARLVTLRPVRYRYLLISVLCNYAGIVMVATARPPFREQWSFLDEPTCPAELKILAADKISTWRRYTAAHERLFACTTLQMCFATAKEVIDNYTENRQIHAEFAYYKENHTLLGKHQIFKVYAEIEDLKHLSVAELFRRRENLEGAIWRAKNEIAKDNKPHLRAEREQRISYKQQQLAALNRLLEKYA